MIVDVHAHALSEDFIREMAKTPDAPMNVEAVGDGTYRLAGYGQLDPLIYDLAGRLESLEARNVGLQLIAPPPPLMSAGDNAADLALARKVNASTEWVVSNGGGLLGGLAVVALGEPDKAADELRRVVETKGFVGVALPTRAGRLPLDEPAFEPLFAAIAELDLFVFMHSTSGPLSATQTEYTLRTLIGWPTETTIAITRLVFAGVLERHPGLKLVLSHGGGTLANLINRIDLGWSAPQFEANPACRQNISRPPSSYIRELYFDTVVAGPRVLKFVIDSFGADHVLFGTDFPYEIGDADGSLAMPEISNRSTEERDAILGGNALNLLGIRAP